MQRLVCQLLGIALQQRGGLGFQALQLQRVHLQPVRADAAILSLVAQTEVHVENARIAARQQRAGGGQVHHGVELVALGQQGQARRLQLQIQQAGQRVAARKALGQGLLQLPLADGVAGRRAGAAGQQGQGGGAQLGKDLSAVHGGAYCGQAHGAPGKQLRQAWAAASCRWAALSGSTGRWFLASR